MIRILAAIAAFFAFLFGVKKLKEDSGPEKKSEGGIFDIRTEIKAQADKNGVSRSLALALAGDESSFNPVRINEAENAIGLFQIRPIAFEEFRRGTGGEGLTHGPNLLDAKNNIRVGVWYMGWIARTLKESFNREPSEREIIWSFKGGIGRVLRNNVTDEARMLAERVIREVPKYA